MESGRVLGSCVALLAVGGGAIVAVAMAGASGGDTAADDPFHMPTASVRVYPTGQPSATFATATTVPTVPTMPTLLAKTASVSATTAATSSHPATHPTSTSAVAGSVASPAAATPIAPAPVKPAARPTTAAPVVRGIALPLGSSTGDATRVVTVVARSYASTTATLQAWDRAPGGGWLRHGSAVVAHLGSQGLTTAPSESKSATPIGSFTLTQAFGAYGNPGTPLPYFRTTAADWWISQSGPLYNTHQHCSAGCAFTLGDPNEHLMYETPYYNYAVVIDYNTRNSPTGVRQGAGSAFFLHVTDGGPTAGCVAIPQSNLVALMQWLQPGTHPRILIGIG